MTKTKENKFYTVEQVADRLQVHWQTVLDFIKSGALEAIKLGKGYRIPVEAFEKFIEERKTNVSLLALASSEEFLSKPKQGKHDRYKSLLIVPTSERENFFPNDTQSGSNLREIVRNEIPLLEPKPDVDGMSDDKLINWRGKENYELYFRSTSNGVLFVRASLLEPEGEVHINHLLSFGHHTLRLAFFAYEKFGYDGNIFLKFRMENVKDNVLKTGSFTGRDLSMEDRALREKIEVDEGPVKLAREAVSDLTVKLVMRINRGFGHDRVAEATLKDFLKAILEGRE